MSDKVKPWQQRKPRHHGANQGKNGRPNRPDGNKRNLPPRMTDDRDIPIRNDWNERWEK